MSDRFLPTLAVLALGCVGCGQDAPKKDAPTKPVAAHEHAKAPHGGELLELGEEEAHVELVHDRKGATLTAYVYGSSVDRPVAVDAPTVLLAGKDGPKELRPVALDAKAGASTASAWRFTDPALDADPLDGRIRLTVGGKTFQTPLEPAGHDHK